MPNGATAPRPIVRTIGVWAAVTVRVAWELMLSGHRVRPAVLADARDHVLLSLPESTSVDEAEVMAGPLTRAYVERATKGTIRRVHVEQDLEITARLVWRRELSQGAGPVADAVLRLHFGDGMSIEDVSRSAAIDGAMLTQARDRLREQMREFGRRDGLPMATWNDARVDQLLARVASVPEPGCPVPTAMLSDGARLHADACPRCSRAVRLVRGGILAPSDLIPAEDAVADRAPIEVAALLLHPDATKSARRLIRTLGTGAVRVAKDAWLMSGAELVAASDSLRDTIEQGMPPRHHIRGALVQGHGRWSGTVLLGPVAVQALEAARSRPWSDVDRLGELPPPRPPPPRATRWWVGAALAAVCSIAVGFEVLSIKPPTPAVPVHAAFTAAEDGWDIRFDVDDLAVIDVVALTTDGLSTVHSNVRAARGQWATGEGDYRVWVPGNTAIILASENGIGDLETLIGAARSQPSPLFSLESSLRAAHPAVAWVASPAISPEEEPSALVGSQIQP